MISKIHSLISSLAVGCVVMAPTVASAAIVLSDDFESYAALGPAAPLTVTGGYDGQNVIGLANNSAFTPKSQYVFLATDSFNNTTTEVIYTPTSPILATAGNTYTLSFDAIRANFAGFPVLTYEILIDSVAAVSNTVDLAIASVTPISVTGVDGNLTLRFFADRRVGTSNFGQAQIDNLTIDATPVPEPASLALAGSALALGLLRRRR